MTIAAIFLVSAVTAVAQPIPNEPAPSEDRIEIRVPAHDVERCQETLAFVLMSPADDAGPILVETDTGMATVVCIPE